MTGKAIETVSKRHYKTTNERLRTTIAWHFIEWNCCLLTPRGCSSSLALSRGGKYVCVNAYLMLYEEEVLELVVRKN